MKETNKSQVENGLVEGGKDWRKKIALKFLGILVPAVGVLNVQSALAAQSSNVDTLPAQESVELARSSGADPYTVHQIEKIESMFEGLNVTEDMDLPQGTIFRRIRDGDEVEILRLIRNEIPEGELDEFIESNKHSLHIGGYHPVDSSVEGVHMIQKKGDGKLFFEVLGFGEPAGQFFGGGEGVEINPVFNLGNVFGEIDGNNFNIMIEMVAKQLLMAEQTIARGGRNNLAIEILVNNAEGQKQVFATVPLEYEQTDEVFTVNENSFPLPQGADTSTVSYRIIAQ